MDSDGRLFWVRDVVPVDLVQEIAAIEWLVLPREMSAPQQAEWHRRAISPNSHPIQKKLSESIRKIIPVIEQHCGIQYDFVGEATLWLDLPGFSVTRHTDGHLPSTLQLFWIAPGTEYGTVFYDPHGGVLKAFEFQPNTGYLMLNQPNPDGSQPLLWHGMNNVVPEDTYRLTSYSVLGTYKHK